MQPNSRRKTDSVLWLTAVVLAAGASVPAMAAKPTPSQSDATGAIEYVRKFEIETLRLAIDDLGKTFQDEYKSAAEYTARLDKLSRRRQRILAALETDDKSARGECGTLGFALSRLKHEALLANPLLDFERLILLKRKRGQIGLPTNHQCNPCLPRTGYDNEIAVISPVRPNGPLTTIFRPSGGRYVGEIDLNSDADRLLFTMPNDQSWEIHEIDIDGGNLRQVSRQVEAVDNFDACYLPDGRITFASTASFTGVPCWHGKERACSLYLMNPDGFGVRQLCFDQDLDLHPSVLSNGQVIYSRWDYTGTMHIYLRPLMVMNPDGTGQRAIYGSNSYYPNALYYPRGIPGAPNKIAAILSGYHGVNRAGELVVLDTSKGWREADGIVRRIAHRNEPPVPIVRDNLVGNSWPKFLHPYPLSEKYFIAAAQVVHKGPWGIYLVDVFDNMLALATDPAFDFFEPIPVSQTPRPPEIPDRVDLDQDDAVVYLHDVYAGPGLKGVPHGSVKRLRIVAYNFGFPGMAGPDKIGRAGPWDAMRILGTVPVYEDGSAAFRVPAGTPVSIQPLDEQGKALQLMRSWYTAMPGEVASCVGCHEQPSDTPLVRYAAAATRPPVEIEPWYGPARGFDFQREVQPVLDRYCVGCHDGQPRPDGRTIPDLRSEELAGPYQGLPLSKLGANRLEPELRQKFPSTVPASKLHGDKRMLYTPAYEALVPLIRRVNIEDYVGLHVPGEYHADTSELIQMLQKGHHNVRLDDEAWDRLITWIDLNGPCHGTWGDVSPIPGGADRRRWELAQEYDGPKQDAETVPETTRTPIEPILPEPLPKKQAPAAKVADWPFDAREARRRQRAAGRWEKIFDLGQGETIRLVRIPAGEFVMGSSDGQIDEQPASAVAIPRDFWISDREITNRQFQLFDSSHYSGLFMKRSLDVNGPGVPLDEPQQPAVRVSWLQAMEFCRRLSDKSGIPFTLPTEAQWEYACRAGSGEDLSYGGSSDDFSTHANMADKTLNQIHTVTGGVVVLLELPHDGRFDDGALATSAVGSYRPNAWGLFDMHGNAAEWTLTTYAPYPYLADDGRNDAGEGDPKVVRGGSFRDRPKRCRSAFRLSYPSWQRVHNVGFRIVLATGEAEEKVARAE
jgi:formylglycine-generating enzyme required for sulfatase activity